MEWGDWGAGDGGRTLPSSFPTAWAHLISQTVPGRLHTWEVAQGLRSTPALAHWCFFPKPKLSPRSPAPAGRAQCWGEGAAPTDRGECGSCQHPQTSQRGAGSTPGKGRAMPNHREGWGEVSAGILQLWDRLHQGLTVSGSHTAGIISKSLLRRAQTPERGPALAWAALEAFLCLK